MTEALQTVTLNHKNVTWNSQPEQLTCVIVEPRNHANLQGALYYIIWQMFMQIQTQA